jgi:hypothetical protein
MNQIVDNAYTATSNLFGPESGIPWWAWLFVVAAIVFKMLVPKTAREIADDRDQMMLQELLGGGGGGGKQSKKQDKKKKK